MNVVFAQGSHLMSLSSLSAFVIELKCYFEHISIRGSLMVKRKYCLKVTSSLCCVSAEVHKELHNATDYPCEVVGSWNTWYGEQDQAGRGQRKTSLVVVDS